MSFLKNMFSTGKLITVHIKRNNSTTILKAKPGENLMDLTNKLVNSNSNIYGLCDKQLACTTCSVNIKTHYDLLPEATDEEVDVLFQLKNYRDGYECHYLEKQEWRVKLLFSQSWKILL